MYSHVHVVQVKHTGSRINKNTQFISVLHIATQVQNKSRPLRNATIVKPEFKSQIENSRLGILKFVKSSFFCVPSNQNFLNYVEIRALAVRNSYKSNSQSNLFKQTLGFKQTPVNIASLHSCQK